MLPHLGALGRSWGVFFAFFSLFVSMLFFISILDRFFVDFEGFWKGFERPKRFKNRDFRCFIGYAFRDLIFGRILLDV